MKSYYIYFLLLTAINLSSQTQNPFLPIAEQYVQLDEMLEVGLPLNDYATFELQRDILQTALMNVPLESVRNIKTVANQVTLPLPNGSSRQYRIVESPVMQADLQARWPQLRTYRILDIENPGFSGRISVTPSGVQGVYQSPDGDVFIEPYAYGQDRYYVVYYQHEVVLAADNVQQLSCGYIADDHEDGQPVRNNDTVADSSSSAKSAGPPAEIKEYLIALTCTGEYAQNKGGTTESVLASFVSAINIVNSTFERELSIRVTLINQIEDIIFLIPASDPFVNANQGGALLSQVRNAIVNVAGVPAASYGMGHLFTAGCSDVGGVVSGRTCTVSKERAVTCHASSNLGAVVRRIMTHEIGHQFSVGHTFSNCPGSEGQMASNSAFEPGSGSTIMSYAGSCGDQNIQFNNDDYYHSGSIAQFMGFVQQGPGGTCATTIETSGNQPDVSLPYSDGFYIPISTPFELDGSASDTDDDPLTYCWEQMDLGFSTPLGEPTANAPLFRSFSPTTVTNRYFPRIQDIVNNNSDNREVLPTYSRALNFRFTARDNNEEIGSAVWQDVAFRSTSTAGPFLVLEPDTASIEWRVGEYREVRWDVANTDNEVVNCQRVNVRLSSDGGMTYPLTLIAETPNTGSAFVSVPDQIGSNMRIRVEAADNVFFDISNTNFEIKEAIQATYTLGFNPVVQQVCLPGLSSVVFNTSSILGYDSLVNLSIVSELPSGMTASFSATAITPGESSQLDFDMLNLENFHGQLAVTIAGAASGQDTFYRTLILDIVDNDFTELNLLLPLEGQADILLNTDFSWQDMPNAWTYDWQLSNDAAFNNIIASASELEDPAFTPSDIQLDANELFYWRVRTTNACGVSEWLPPGVFHTVNSICSPKNSEDTPINIPGTGPPPTRMSQIYVPFNGEITDINVPYVNIRYQPIQNFTATLISPAGTEVLLYDQSCFTTEIVNIGFNDEAPNGIICPPDGQFLFQPVEPLAAFTGENTQGDWTLKVKVLETGFGAPGQLGNWGIEFCAEGNAAAPTLLVNDTLFVPPLMANPITNELLRVSDDEQGAEQLTYTIVSTPGHGQLYWVDQELVPGSTFRQSSIDALNVNYVSTSSDATEDAFTFVVEDGTGGFLPVQRFNIVIAEDAVVNTEEVVVFQNVKLYPNPAHNMVTLEWDDATRDLFDVKVVNVHGQLLYQNQLPKAASSLRFSINNWPKGMYFVQIGTRVFKLVKQ